MILLHDLAKAWILLHPFVGKARVERHASIDEERRADHVVGGVAGQPDGGAANVFRLADATIGDERQQALVGFIGIPGLAVDRRANCAGRDGIDADALGRNLLRQTAHHHVNATLRGRVVDMTCPRYLLVHRAHADDLANRARHGRDGAAAAEFPDGFARAQELPGEIDRDDRVPLLQGHGRDRRVLLQPGVRDQNIQGPELRPDALEHLGDRALIGDVRLVRERFAACCGNRVDHALGRVIAR